MQFHTKCPLFDSQSEHGFTLSYAILPYINLTSQANQMYYVVLCGKCKISNW